MRRRVAWPQLPNTGPPRSARTGHVGMLATPLPLPPQPCRWRLLLPVPLSLHRQAHGRRLGLQWMASPRVLPPTRGVSLCPCDGTLFRISALTLLLVDLHAAALHGRWMESVNGLLQAQAHGCGAWGQTHQINADTQQFSRGRGQGQGNGRPHMDNFGRALTKHTPSASSPSVDGSAQRHSGQHGAIEDM